MQTAPATFRLDPSNCVIDFTLYTGSESTHVMKFSTLSQSLELSKTLLDDIERKAVVSFVDKLLDAHLEAGIDITDEAYCAGLAESLGIERIIIRVKVKNEPPPPARRKGPKNQAALESAMNAFANAVVTTINAEQRAKEVEAEMVEAFRGTSEEAFEVWASQMDLEPDFKQDMRALWKRANP